MTGSIDKRWNALMSFIAIAVLCTGGWFAIIATVRSLF